VNPGPHAVAHRRSSHRSPLVPPQHGAWGFLALPLLLGVAASRWSPWLVLLAVTWVAAYPCGWALTGILTSRRPERFHRAAAVWTPICVLAGTPLLAARPWLLWALMTYAVLFSLSLRHARARRERSMTNNLLLIAECVLLVPVVAGVAAGRGSSVVPPLVAMTTPPVLIGCLITALALVGSTLHVKSLIRERNNPAYTAASRAFAMAAPAVLAVGCVLLDEQWWLVAPFLLLAARAFWLHDPNQRPVRIGLIELAGLLSIATTAFVAL
jgi:hypothetical protein